MRTLADAGWMMRFALSRSARTILTPERFRAFGADLPPASDADDADVDGLLDGNASVLVPLLSVTTAAKVACGIQDSLPSRLLARALERGMPVLAAFDGCCPDNPQRLARGFSVTDAYKARLHANVAALKSYGIRLVVAGEMASVAAVLMAGRAPIPTAGFTAQIAPPTFSAEVSREKEAPVGGKRIFSRADAMGYREEELRLGQDVLVTPLAADELRIRNVRLIQA
jgi:hypothetical protein